MGGRHKENSKKVENKTEKQEETRLGGRWQKEKGRHHNRAKAGLIKENLMEMIGIENLTQSKFHTKMLRNTM